MPIVVLLGVALLLPPGQASAAALDFTGSLSFTYIPYLARGFPLGTAGSFDHAGSGVGVSLTGPNQVGGFAGVSGFSGTGTATVNGTFQPPTLWRFRVTGIGNPSFSGSPLHGPMAVRGFLTVTGPSSTVSTYPFTQDGTAGLGLGGTLSYARFGQWTTGVAQLTGVATASPGTRSTTISASGFDLRTPNGAGDLQLVTPIRIITDIGEPDLGGFAVLNLKFVPEPNALLVLAAGLATLLGLKRRRSRAASARRS